VDTFRRIVREVGVCMIGQTAELAPADKRIYALRDVSATVEAIPLIVASILSKKLAEGIDALVLDVKVGRGAFMKNRAQARELGAALCEVGQAAGKRVSALLTDMDAPLGRTVGNALETREAIDILRGRGPTICSPAPSPSAPRCWSSAGRRRPPGGRDAPARGHRQRRRCARVRAHDRSPGGDPRVVADPERLPSCDHLVEVLSDTAGWSTPSTPSK